MNCFEFYLIAEFVNNKTLLNLSLTSKNILKILKNTLQTRKYIKYKQTHNNFTEWLKSDIYFEFITSYDIDSNICKREYDCLTPLDIQRVIVLKKIKEIDWIGRIVYFYDKKRNTKTFDHEQKNLSDKEYEKLFKIKITSQF